MRRRSACAIVAPGLKKFFYVKYGIPRFRRASPAGILIISAFSDRGIFMKKMIWPLVAAALLGFYAAAFAAYLGDFSTRAVIVYREPGCPYFIAEGPNYYYLIMEWRDGYDPVPGQIVLGDFRNIGYSDAYYPEPDRKGAVYVEATSLSRTEAIVRYYKICLPTNIISPEHEERLPTD